MKALIEWRKRRGINKNRAARLLGVTWTFLDLVEKGERNISAATALAWERRSGGELDRKVLLPEIFDIPEDRE